MKLTVNPLLTTAYFLLFYLQLSSLELVCQQNEDVIKKREVAIKELQSELDRQAQIAAMIHNLSSGKVPITNFAGKSSWPRFNMLSVSFFLSPVPPLSSFSLFCFFSSSSSSSSCSAPSSSPLPPHHHHWHHPGKEVKRWMSAADLLFYCPFLQPKLSFNATLSFSFLTKQVNGRTIRLFSKKNEVFFLLIWLQIFHRRQRSVFWKDCWCYVHETTFYIPVWLEK